MATLQRIHKAESRVGCYVLGFAEIDRTQGAVVGGKGAHLGELSRMEDIHVPQGFA
jgi:phosphoenolpyruvate synthase/pyruvate phosphate dikinase